MYHLRFIAATAALLALGGAASAQFGSPPMPSVPGPGTRYNSEGRYFDAELGDRIAVNGVSLLITKYTRLPTGVPMEINGKSAIIPDRPYVELGVMFGTFSIAGPIPQNDGGFLGGTKSVSNALYTVDVGLNRGTGQQPRISVGGWYFAEDPQQRNSDLYQVHLRAIQRNGLGAQVGYLNSTTQDVPAVTLHALFQVESSRLLPDAKIPWAIEIGLGTFLDVSPEKNVVTGVERPMKTFNLSVFTQGRVGLNERVSLTGSFWFVRDRNVDWSRFGVGLAYKF